MRSVIHYDPFRAISVIHGSLLLSQVNGMSFSANADHLLLANGEGSVDIVQIKAEGLTKIDSIAAHTSNCVHLKVDRDYQRMVVGSADYQLSFWDLNDLICYKFIPFECVASYPFL